MLLGTLVGLLLTMDGSRANLGAPASARATKIRPAWMVGTWAYMRAEDPRHQDMCNNDEAETYDRNGYYGGSGPD
jgi:hypothetical protein